MDAPRVAQWVGEDELEQEADEDESEDDGGESDAVAGPSSLVSP